MTYENDIKKLNYKERWLMYKGYHSALDELPIKQYKKDEMLGLFEDFLHLEECYNQEFNNQEK